VLQTVLLSTEFSAVAGYMIDCRLDVLYNAVSVSCYIVASNSGRCNLDVFFSVSKTCSCITLRLLNTVKGIISIEEGSLYAGFSISSDLGSATDRY
jgi:hypothetical protein